MKKTAFFLKDENGFMAIYATLIMALLLVIVAAWVPMKTQTVKANIEKERAVAAESLANGELSRVSGYLKLGIVDSPGILDNISARAGNLTYHALKTNDGDNSDVVSGSSYAIYTEPRLDSGAESFIVTAIAKVNGTTKIVRKTVELGNAENNTGDPSKALLNTQKAGEYMLDVVGYGAGYGYYRGRRLTWDVYETYNTGDYSNFLETDEDFLNKLLGTQNYKDEIQYGYEHKLYWRLTRFRGKDKSTAGFYLTNLEGFAYNRAYAVAIPTDDGGFIYYRSVRKYWDNRIYLTSGAPEYMNTSTIENAIKKIKRNRNWEAVNMS